MSVYVPSNCHPFTVSRPWMSSRSMRIGVATAAALVALGGIVSGAHVAGVGRGLNEMPAYSHTVRHPLLSAGDSSVQQQYGFITVTGAVRNESARALRDVEAVVELFDPAGRLIGVDSALVTMASLPAGEDSSYRVQMSDPGNVAAYRVRFRRLSGSFYPSR